MTADELVAWCAVLGRRLNQRIGETLRMPAKKGFLWRVKGVQDFARQFTSVETRVGASS
jgi:hypothetical protein